AVTGPDDRLGADLIGDPEARRPVDLVLHVTRQVDVADTTDADLTGVDVHPSPVARLVHRLRAQDVGPDPVVERELRRRTPGVLQVAELAPLQLACVRVGADVAVHGARVAEQEGRQTQAAPARSRGALLVEVQ